MKTIVNKPSQNHTMFHIYIFLRSAYLIPYVDVDTVWTT